MKISKRGFLCFFTVGDLFNPVTLSTIQNKLWAYDNEQVNAELQVMASQQEELERCVCRKCGETVSCRYIHNSDQSHEETLCGTCAL